MNRYHLAILFGAIALMLFALVDARANAAFAKHEADAQTKDTLHFAMASAVNTLSSKFGSANDCYAISSNYFKALSELNNSAAIKLGRVLPQDFYPHVPAMVYMEDRYYNIGYFDGTDYRWDKELPYSEDWKLLSEVPKESVLALIEKEIGDRVNSYRRQLNLLEVNYTLPDYMMRNVKSGTIITAVESFPTTINGYYYSGLSSETASIKWKREE